MNPTTSPSKSSSQSPPTTRLYVSNIPFSHRENDLMDMFKPFGPVLNAEVVFNEKGSKGFGFVTLETVEQCLAAIEKINGIKVKGRKVEVKWASARVYQPKKPKSTPSATSVDPDVNLKLLSAQQHALAALIAQTAPMPGLLPNHLFPQPLLGFHPAYLNQLLHTSLLQGSPMLDGQAFMHHPLGLAGGSQKQPEFPRGWPLLPPGYPQYGQVNMMNNGMQQQKADHPNLGTTNHFGSIGLAEAQQHWNNHTMSLLAKPIPPLSLLQAAQLMSQSHQRPGADVSKSDPNQAKTINYL